MWLAALLLLLLTASCSGTQTVVVQVLVPDLAGRETPLAGVVVTASPYDRDSILAILEERAPEPRPHTQALDSLFQAFRTPFLAFARATWQLDQLRRKRDSLVTERQGARSEAARGELGPRLSAVEDSLRSLEPQVARLRQSLGRARDTLWPRIERLRGDVDRWEKAAHAGYDSAVRVATRSRFDERFTDTTDARGWVRLVLPSAGWRVLTRSPDLEDPNAQWSWNVPVTGDTLRLTPANARHLPRY